MSVIFEGTGLPIYPLLAMSSFGRFFSSFFCVCSAFFQTFLDKLLSGNLLASKKDYWFLPKNSDIILGSNSFFYKDIFIYHIKSAEPKKKLGCVFFCVFFKDIVVERSKTILKIGPNLLHF